jgi:hypothetical protein
VPLDGVKPGSKVKLPGAATANAAAPAGKG